MASKSIHQVMGKAMRHSAACRALLEQDRLSEALAYCVSQQVEPPQFPGGVRAAGEQVSALLQDCGWWGKRLKIRRARVARRARLQAQQPATPAMPD
jgi:hypothetical protein